MYEGEDYSNLYKLFKEKKVCRILHMLSLKGTENNEMKSLTDFENSQRKGVYSLFSIVKCLTMNDLAVSFELIIISDYTYEVTKEEIKLKPENATLFGFGKAVTKEFPSILCRGFDIDGAISAEELVCELDNHQNNYLTAFRNGEKYIQEFRPINLSHVDNRNITLEKDGIYVITGGSGGIALELCKSLIFDKGVKVALMSRTALPPSCNECGQLFNYDICNNKTRRLIETMNTIFFAGKTVEYIQADVSDYEQVDNVFKKLRSKYGKINGVIHCAGASDESIINNNTMETFRNVLRPKVYGAYILDCVTQNDKLSFFVMFSSMCSIFGMPGQSAYTAANCYLDAFESSRNRDGKITLTINWAAWKETGMAKDYGVNFDHFFKTINNKQGIDAFYKVLNESETSIAIGEINYGGGIIRPDSFINIKLADEIKENLKNHTILSQTTVEKGKNILLGKETGEYTETETIIADICIHELAIDEINIDDDLYKLGATSIMAIAIVNEVNRRLQIHTDVTKFMEYYSIKEYARFIDEEYLCNNDYRYKCDKISKLDIKTPYYPVSSSQKGIYLSEQIGNVGISYNVPSVMCINGKFDIEKAREVLVKITYRHDAFRTFFDIVNGEIVQKIEDNAIIDFTCHINVTKDIDELIYEFIKPFDLSVVPLFRVSYISCQLGKQYLLFDMHHIIFDGISANIIVKEFLSLYNGDSLPPQELQYKDFVIWQKKYLQSEEIINQEKYWLNQLSGELPELSLPYDYKRPDKKSYNGHMISFSLSKEETYTLDKYAKANKSTLYMVLLAVYNVLLYKYTKQEDIIIGTPITGRNHPDVENLVGVFINTLPLRNFPKDNKTFDTFLQEIKENVLQAFNNQDYQFESMVEKVYKPKGENKHPIFDTMLIMQNIEYPLLNTEEITLIPYKFMNHSAKFDVKIEAFNRNETLYFTLDYCTDLFDKETIIAFANNYVYLLKNIITNSKMFLKDISLVGKNKSSILFDFNNDCLNI